MAGPEPRRNRRASTDYARLRVFDIADLCVLEYGG
jgi:hypothetical protein